MQYLGTTVTSTDRLFTLSASSSIDASGTATNSLTFANTGSIVFTGATGPVTLTLTGTQTTANVFNPLLADNAGGPFATSLAKTGAGTWTLPNANTYSGGTALSAGLLNLGNLAAIGTGTFTITGGSFNNTTGAAGTLTNNNAQSWGGGYTFVGANSMNMGTGNITLTLATPITVTASALTEGGNITGNFLLTKLGAGTLTLNGTSSSNAGMTLSAGLLNIGNLAAIGSGAFTIGGGSFDNTTGSAGTLTNNNVQSWGGAYTFVGTNSLNMGTGAVTMTAATPVTVTANTLEVDGNISAAALTLTKQGAGALTLGGAITTTGIIAVNGGTLNLTGSIAGNATTTVLNFGGTAATTVVNVSANQTLTSIAGGNVAGAVAVYNQTAGIVNAGYATDANTTNYVGGAGGYGYFNLTGGTFNQNSTRFNVTSGAGTGVVYVANATLNVKGTYFLTAYNALANLGSVTVGSGGVIDHSGASQNMAIFWASANLVSAPATGVMNVAGGTIITTTKSISFGGAGAGTNYIGFLNVAAGTVQTGSTVVANNTAAGNIAYINFAGGTLKPTAALAGMLPATSADTTVTTTLFGPINNTGIGGPIFNGGLVVDTSSGGSGSTLTNSLLGATGNGVTQANISIPVTGNSGYVGAPFVNFTGGTLVANGTPASGYALISGGQVAGIVITDPGTYVSGSTPTITLTGGGGTIAAFATSPLTAANVSGGLTKIGAGTFSLSGTNTYSGPTTITGGILNVATLTAIGGNSAIGTGDATSNASNAASLVLNGGTLQYNTAAVVSTNRLFTLNASSSIDSSAALAANILTFSNTNAIALNATPAPLTLTLTGTNTGVNVLAPLIGDSGTGANITSIAKTAAGTWQLTNANTYTGVTTVTAGILSTMNIQIGGVASSIGASAAAAGNLVLNGGTLQYVGTSVASTDHLFTLGASSTIDASGTSTSTLTFSNTGAIAFGVTAPLTLTLTGANTGVNAFAPLIGDSGSSPNITSVSKTGAGTWALTNANTYSGGTALSAGQLNVGNLAAIGTGAFTISGGSFDNTTGSNGTLTNNNAGSWTGTFTYVGSANSLNLGTGAVTLAGATTVTVSANTLETDGNITGTQNLIKAGNGTLVLGGIVGITTGTVTVNAGTLTLTNANTYTGNTTLTAGNLQLTNNLAIQTSNLKLNGGTLQLRNDSAVSFTTPSTVVGGNATIDVNQASFGTNTLLTLGGTVSIGNFTLGVTGGNGYSLALGAITITASSGTFNPTTANVAIASVTAANFNLVLSEASRGEIGVPSRSARAH